MSVELAAGASRKSVRNYLTLLHGIFRYAQRRDYVSSNPLHLVDRPHARRDPDIRYLDLVDLQLILDSVPDDLLGPTDRVLYLAAALTGLRRGELLALRWRDVDWSTRVVRVRRSFARGQFGPGKSGAGRSVPLATRDPNASGVRPHLHAWGRGPRNRRRPACGVHTGDWRLDCGCVAVRHHSQPAVYSRLLRRHAPRSRSRVRRVRAGAPCGGVPPTQLRCGSFC